MKNQNRLERVIIEDKLTVDEQADWRLKLKDMVGLSGIESICLESEELFIEYNPLKQTKEFIHSELKRIYFNLISVGTIIC